MLEELLKSCEGKATLVAVSKNQTCEKILEIYDKGIRDFGENKVQELLSKIALKDDINWHFIGRLQTNKVKDVIKYCCLLHSLDRFDLMEAVNKEAIKQNKIMPCLIQFNLAKEESKAGFKIEDVENILIKLSGCSNIKVEGMMCIGPRTNEKKQIEKVFKEAKNLFDQLKKEENDHFQMAYLSMGMSNDYEVALRCGSNVIRVGSLIFKGANKDV